MQSVPRNFIKINVEDIIFSNKNEIKYFLNKLIYLILLGCNVAGNELKTNIACLINRACIS